MRTGIPTFWRRWFVAALAMAAAPTGTVLLWEPVFHRLPLALFFTAVVVTSLAVGWAPALAVVAVGTAACVYVLRADGVWAVAPSLMFLVLGSLIAFFIEKGQRAGRALSAASVRLRNLVDARFIGVIVGDDTGAIVEANHVFLSMTGYTQDDLHAGGVRWADMTPAEFAAADQEAIRQMGDEGGFQPYEKEFIRKDGSRVPVLIGGARISDAPLTSICYIVDLTAQKRTQLQLRQLNETLENRVAERTTQLRLLTSELTLAEHRERLNLAAALHDELAQSLAMARLRVSALPASTGGQGREAIAEIKNNLDSAIHSTRSIMNDLHPPLLYEVGLAVAVEGLAAKYLEQHALSVRVVSEGKHDFPDDLKAFLFRAVRELLSNVAKHADASEAEVRVTTCPDEVRVTVEDWGSGFEAAALPWRPSRSGGFGLYQIKERVQLFGGEVEIRSREGGGTRATIRVPHGVAAKSDAPRSLMAS